MRFRNCSERAVIERTAHKRRDERLLVAKPGSQKSVMGCPLFLQQRKSGRLPGMSQFDPPQTLELRSLLRADGIGALFAELKHVLAGIDLLGDERRRHFHIDDDDAFQGAR